MTITSDHPGLAEALEANLRSRGGTWDESPQLFFVYDTPEGWDLSFLDLPSDMWSGPPGERLAAMARVFPTVLRFMVRVGGLKVPNAGAGWRGMAFFSESWMVEEHGEKPSPELMAAAEAHLIYTLPQRIECRCLYVSLTDGSTVMVLLDRNGVARVEESELQGRIPESLAKLVNVINDAQENGS